MHTWYMTTVERIGTWIAGVNPITAAKVTVTVLVVGFIIYEVYKWRKVLSWLGVVPALLGGFAAIEIVVSIIAGITGSAVVISKAADYYRKRGEKNAEDPDTEAQKDAEAATTADAGVGEFVKFDASPNANKAMTFTNEATGTVTTITDIDELSKYPNAISESTTVQAHNTTPDSLGNAFLTSGTVLGPDVESDPDDPEAGEGEVVEYGE